MEDKHAKARRIAPILSVITVILQGVVLILIWNSAPWFIKVLWVFVIVVTTSYLIAWHRWNN